MQNIFETIPEGVCKEYIRGRAERLRTGGESMEDALSQAMESSIYLFPEVWVYIRTTVHIPWTENDQQLAYNAVRDVITLREQYIELRDQINRAITQGFVPSPCQCGDDASTEAEPLEESPAFSPPYDDRSDRPCM